MSRLKALAVMLAWFGALGGLYALEISDWPEARSWHMFSWQVWVLGFINVVIVEGVVTRWKEFRRNER